jgi:hypothetical protein
MAQKKEEIIIEDKEGTILVQHLVINNDPYFILVPDSPERFKKIKIERGYKLCRMNERGDEDRRTIVAVTDVSSILSVYIEITAPRQLESPKENKPYLKHSTWVEDEKYIELRPGATIVGGRESGFYDDYGIILDAHHTGGDPQKDEDWIYYVIARSDFGKYAPLWILLKRIGFPVSNPISITEFDIKPSQTIDNLLADGEKELLNYFLHHPKKLEMLSPKQFEDLVKAIYKNLGFLTEAIGSWNQPDGGVDIMALSKTDANDEYRIAIQCKTSKKRISARPIRELAGVLDAFKAHQGIVATTSKFTESAKKEVEGHLWRISLQDKDDLYKKIAKILFPFIRIH